MNISLISGTFESSSEKVGYGRAGSYGGTLGITFDRTENYLFIASADTKTIRKLNYRTTYVGPNITRKPYDNKSPYSRTI